MSKVFKDPMDSVLIRLERDAKSIIKDWYHTLDQSQDQVLIKDLRKSREYDGNALRDLLRVLRNKVSFFIHTDIYLLNFFSFPSISTEKPLPRPPQRTQSLIGFHARRLP